MAAALLLRSSCAKVGHIVGRLECCATVVMNTSRLRSIYGLDILSHVDVYGV